MTENVNQDGNVNSILRELSDIKTNLALNTQQTSNLEKNVNEIKTDIKEIKNDYVSRREFNDFTRESGEKTVTHFVTMEERVNKLYSIVYWFMGLLGTATFASVVAPAIARLFK